MAPFHAQSHTAAVPLSSTGGGLETSAGRISGLAGASFHIPAFIMPFITSLDVQLSSYLVTNVGVFTSIPSTLSLHQAYQMWRSPQSKSFFRGLKACELKPYYVEPLTLSLH